MASRPSTKKLSAATTDASTLPPLPVTSMAPVAVAAPLSGTPHKTSPVYQHDVARQANLLRDALQSDRVRVGFFLGAGCPLGVYDKMGEKSLNLIADVAALTSMLHTKLIELDRELGDDEKLVPCWNSLVQACRDGGDSTPNVENILTELRTITGRKGKKPLDGFDKDRFAALDIAVCDLIVDAVGKRLPSHRCSYRRFASWVGGIQRAAPVEIFTPNYDLLMEEAFEQQRIPHFDGFVGSREPFFDIASIEQDAIPKRWARLWKLHGSINWQRGDGDTVFRAQGPAAKGKAMIYPSHLKYDQSRRMPYLAMIDRLRAFFRAAETTKSLGPPVLVVCGYSFSDEHLNEVLLDGLRGNQAAQCFVLGYKSLADSRVVANFASERPNLTVLAWDGAVVGTREGQYCEPRSASVSPEPWIFVDALPAGAPTSAAPVRCRLGDFHFFALLLEQLYGGRNDIDNAAIQP